jgi:protein ImuB
MKRVISLWFPRLSTDRLARLDPNWRGRPAATLASISGGQRLACVNEAAQRVGLHRNLKLADARAILPELQVTPEDIGADKRLLERLASWCDRYTPWVALDEMPDQPGYGLFLDISGCAHLFGGGDKGESILLNDLVTRLEKVGFTCRTGLADTAGAAWAMAHANDGARAQRIVAPGGQRQALAELEVAALRLPQEAIETLNKLGLRRIGDLYSLPRAPLTNRFGPLVLARLDQALGRSVENIEPRRPTPPFRCRLAFAEPIGKPEDIAAATSRLLASLGSQLESAGMGARQIELVLYRVDGSFERCEIGTSQPSRDADHLLRLFTEPLGQVDAGFGVELMLLTARSAERFSGKQTSLQQGENEDGKADELIDRLTARLGPDRVIRLMPRQSHIPERAVQRVSASNAAVNGGMRSAVALKEDWRIFTQPTATRAPAIRPVRLLATPEPIDVTAPVPDDPPLQFRWRQQAHRVVRVDGPERLANEWWREQDQQPAAMLNATPSVRDYYRIEAEDGQRYWIYRDGPFNSIAGAGGTRTARWYLHGFCT